MLFIEKVHLLEGLLDRWIEQHTLNNLPIHILYFAKMKLLYILGKESTLPPLLDAYTEGVGKYDVAAQFVQLAKAVQAMTSRAFTEAIPLFEHVINNSS